MDTYGVLSEIVAISGSLIGAASAIGFAWMRRTRWLPPEEAVPGATAKVSALVCAVIIGILYVRRQQIGLDLFSWIAIGSLLLTIFSLLSSIYINTTYSFTKAKIVKGKSQQRVRILGGSQLTPEALKISREKGLNHQQLLENAHLDEDLVWTKQSRASVLIQSTLGYILLQASGSIALASTALLLSLSTPNGLDP